MYRFLLRCFLFACAALCLAVAACSERAMAQDLRVPASVTAGEEATIPTTGSGSATFYLVGPGVSRKSDVRLGEEIRLRSQDVRNAGDYLALLCSDTCHSGTFYVIAAKPAVLAFLVHPSSKWSGVVSHGFRQVRWPGAGGRFSG